MTNSRFALREGSPDPDEIEVWAENYFQGLLKMMNGFYARADMKQVLDSMQAIPFHNLTTQELAGESAAVMEMAINCINEIAAREIEYLQAYLNQA